ncbi:hypothetical protein C8R46DRAFT_1077095 [Mycena filopes]|nr:hypothetical protein C8R46DRAFT_1077095 [Mycena filopes]
MASSPDPVVSADLEREIFELAAVLHPGTIPTLLLVARRVLIWLEPLLYTIVRTDLPPMLRALERVMATKPPSFFLAVRHICLINSSWSVDTTQALLRLCPRLESLAYLPPHGKLALQTLIEVKRWSGCLTDLFDNALEFDLSLPVFRNVTHMDIFEDLDPASDTNGTGPVICESLPKMPALTHLCLSRSVPAEITRRLLDECVHLQILVNIWTGPVYDRIAVTRLLNDNGAGVTDVRFVAVLSNDYWGDWGTGARGGVDFWAAAESFVASKRRGEIDRASNIVDEW